jgi:serine/threonine-protein kinase
MPRSAGDKLGPYEILASIGAGGMGQVYRARDARLNRDVAIKVSGEQFSQRFESEAKAIAALNHPNICQIYDVGPDFLVMEYIDGRPIVDLERQQAIPPVEALQFARQIAAALETAHGKGIIHRDLKPANILATSAGVVKLLDFGLAKQNHDSVTEDETLSSAMTQAGTIMGTPAYMSPEQAEGKPADARSDIFSFGVVFYEMLAGHRAFSGGSSAAILGAIVHKNPEPLNAPPALEAIVRKCLAKSPDDRFQTVTQLRTTLEQASTRKISGFKRRGVALAVAASLLIIVAAGFSFFLRRPRAGVDSIAVLPLENRGNDPDAEYISDGVTESINNSLARLPSLKVTPHSVALHYKGMALDVQKVGDQLGVQTVLTGNVRQRGEDLTINVELDDIRSGKQLWGEQYNRKIADLLAVQSDIARAVSQRLRSQLSAEDQQQLTKGSTDNPEAYRLYLKGKYYTNKLTKEGFDTGIDYFNQAIAVDSNYALAYSGLAFNYVNQDDWFMSPNEAGPKTKDAVQRALAIDESDAGAHLSMAIVTHWYDWNWAAAEREFQRAIALSPNFSEAHSYYSWFLAPMGKHDQSLAEARLARQADPLSGVASYTVGAALVFARQWDSAIPELHQAIGVDPNFWFSHCFLGRAYEQKGKLPEAIDEFKRAVELEKDNAETWSGLGHAYALSGNRAEAQKIIDHLKEVSAHSWVAPYSIAVIQAGLGQKDQAFAALEQAYKDRSYYLPTYLATDSRLDGLRSDPRFAELHRLVGLRR